MNSLKSQPAVSGVFLDLDGTVADSLGVMVEVYHDFLAANGRAGSKSEFDQLNGPPLSVVVERLCKTHGLDKGFEHYYRSYQEMIVRSYDGVAANDGAERLMRASKSSGASLAIVTSNSSELCKRWLEKRGLIDLVDAVVGGEDVVHGKPAPDPYLKGLAVTDSQASTSIAVEDSRSGVEAARAAGLKAFYYSTPAGRAASAGLNATTVSHLDEVTSYLANSVC